MSFEYLALHAPPAPSRLLKVWGRTQHPRVRRSSQAKVPQVPEELEASIEAGRMRPLRFLASEAHGSASRLFPTRIAQDSMLQVPVPASQQLAGARRTRLVRAEAAKNLEANA